MSTAPLRWQPLPWDSDFLGFPVAQLLAAEQLGAAIRAAIAAARQAGIRLLYVVLDPADTIVAASARQVGAWQADSKVTLRKKPLPTDQQRVRMHIALAAASTPLLEALAQQAGFCSRFRRDTHFAAGVF